MEAKFKPETKMAELITQCHRTILILQRFGISFGFGEQTVAEVCGAHHVSVEVFLRVCNLYANEHLPEYTALAGEELRELVNYLLSSHTYYLKDRLPHIETHVCHLADKSPVRYGAVLKQFYREYCGEVRKHFEYEETQLFPYILSLLDSGGVLEGNFSVLVFEENHSNIEDKLDDLTSIIMKYMPVEEVTEAERGNVLFDLFQLSSDLKKHTSIEDRLLIPSVEQLERRAV